MSLARSTSRTPERTMPAGDAPPDETTREHPLLVIEAGAGAGGLALGRLWEHRELILFLIWRDLKVRYKQTVLGVLWAVAQPVAAMVIFTWVFGRLGGLDRRVPVPYPLFALSGIVLWIFFAAAVSQGAQSIVANRNLISKIYFPRLVLPVAALGAPLVDLAISCVLMLGLVIGFGLSIGPSVLWLPASLATAAVAAAGSGILLAAWTVAYRDFQHLIGFLLQVWMFASPLAYPIEAVPAAWRWVYSLNPMVAPIGLGRAAFLSLPIEPETIGVSIASGVALLLLAAAHFRRAERAFADIA